MKKWAPYKSLPEHDPKIIEMKKNRQKVEKPKLSMDEAEIINEILATYQGQQLEMKYFSHGEIQVFLIFIAKIDVFNGYLISTDKKKYYLKNIVGLKNK